MSSNKKKSKNNKKNTPVASSTAKPPVAAASAPTSELELNAFSNSINKQEQTDLTSSLVQGDGTTSESRNENGNGTAALQSESNPSSNETEAVEEKCEAVETSTDDKVATAPSSDSKKKRNKKKKTTATAQAANVAEKIDTEEVAKSEQIHEKPEKFVEEDNSEHLDHLMTEMKMSLSATNSSDANRVLSPIENPVQFPLDVFTEALAKGETILTHGLVM